MKKISSKILEISFYLLFFGVPLILYTKTSELFEFNKMVLTYFLTIVITSAWILKMISKKKFIFQRTVFDIPLIIFIASQLLSTIFSIDTRTSLLGYYSRFNGGLLSTLSYSFLYWAFVSNMGKKKTLNSIYVLLFSGLLVSIYGVLEHLGIDKDVWVQDVQNRVFSTLGQPNWLAAWLTLIIPVTWSLAILNLSRRKNENQKLLERVIKSPITWIFLSCVFFITLLFTKSRSGIAGFVVSDLVFVALLVPYFLKKSEKPARKIKLIAFSNIALIIIAILIGTPWTPDIFHFLSKTKVQEVIPQGPALEVGGSDSGQIRLVVWKGAIDIWKNYPVFGSGVETFAYSYYRFRHAEHNLLSEWDFLYNKAHNEYLNYLATTGTIGFLAYTGLIATFLFWSTKKSIQEDNKSVKIMFPGFVAGYVSLLISNFFGFSVVPTALLFFLYPALSICLLKDVKREEVKKYSLNGAQKIVSLVVITITGFFIYQTGKYWYGDYLYAAGQRYYDSGDYTTSAETLLEAIKVTSSEGFYWDELARASAQVAVALNQQKDKDNAQKVADVALNESKTSIALSPANVNFYRNLANLYIKLSDLNQNYLINARDTLVVALGMAPTDAKISYNLGLTYLRTGDIDKSEETLKKTIEMKSNYRDPRFALALIYIEKKDNKDAKEELNYILTNINPNDTVIKEQLDSLGK